MAAPWADGLTIGEVLHAMAQRHPEHEALVFPQHGYRATYAEYAEQVDAAARGLISLGVEAGDRVAVWSTNRPEWVLLQIAAARVGAILVTVNPAFHEEELLYVLKQSGARALFLTDSFKSTDYFATTLAALPELADAVSGQVRAAGAPELRWVVSFPEEHPACMLGWDSMIGQAEGIDAEVLRSRAAELGAEDPVNLQYTSGTTGLPKGVLLSHRNLLLNAYYLAERQHFEPHDRICSPVPLYHCFGCVIGVLGALISGATLLVPAEYFDALATLECMETENATAIYGVPTMFIALLEHPSYASRAFPALRTGVMAGAPCPVELMRKVIDDLGAAEMTIAYGLTESSPGATQTLTDDSLERRVETVGTALPGVEVAILDPDSSDPCPDGVQGEVCIRGHNVMLGYFDMPEATAAAIDESGWLHSGDLGERDADGYVRITGRIKDMVIRGGENLYPREIEEVLYRHSAVESAEVVGVPDERFGEELCACVKVHDDAEATATDLRDFCGEHLAHFKVPRYVMFVEDFPTTVTGKVQKFALRDVAAQRIRDGKGVDDARAAVAS